MLLRVFPNRTSYTPDDDWVRIGEPGLEAVPPEVDRIHVSCTFTWDRDECEELAEAWRSACPWATVMVGGPGCGAPGKRFLPGAYVKFGVSISSRGCPSKCPWCLVPEREGGLRMLSICPGNIIQDANVLAFPRSHFDRLCAMLRTQKRIRFTGGLDVRRLKDWHMAKFRTIAPSAIRELWFAADEEGRMPALRDARQKFRPMLENYSDNGRRKMRCYVLIGFGDEAISQAKRRLQNVWEAGFLPFAQIYRPPEGKDHREDADWRALQREWSRPAAMYANHK